MSDLETTFANSSVWDKTQILGLKALFVGVQLKSTFDFLGIRSHDVWFFLATSYPTEMRELRTLPIDMFPCMNLKICVSVDCLIYPYFLKVAGCLTLITIQVKL